MDASYSFPHDTTRFKEIDRIAQVLCIDINEGNELGCSNRSSFDCCILS